MVSPGMASPGDRKRKAEDRDTSITAPSPMSRDPEKVKGKTTSTGDADVWHIGNAYFYDNCLSLYKQHVEMLNAEFQQFFRDHPDVTKYWHVCEYLRRIKQLKDLYQSPFVGKILTCGLADMCSLGYEHSTTRPHLVKSFDLKICKISCGSTFTIMTDIDGKVYTFGGQDEGAMGRDGEDYDGDLQVRGFIPTTATPVANEDSCIVKVAGGYAKSLALSIHGNLYAFGCHRDYHETHIREEPPDTNIADKNGKKFPFGFNSTPVQVSMPVPVVDMATGAFGNAAIGEDGGVYTWGVGTMGELGRPLAQDHIRDQDPKSARYYVDFVINDLMKPKIVPAIRGKVAISVACGQGHLMVVVREPGHLESTVYGSGLNKDGQLGLCDTQDRKILTPLAYTRTEQMMIREVKAGQFHTLALSLDGKRLYACGRNDYGQCGVSGVVSTPDARETKLKLIQFPNVDDLEIEQIACGELHNLAIGKPPGGHGRVYTWGSTVPAEDACCLGHGDEENEYRPRELVLTKSTGELVVGSVWRQASGGSQHSTFLYTPSPKSK